MQFGWVCKMFEWFINLFVKTPEKLEVNSSGYYYVVSVKGVDAYRCLTKKEAEKTIEELFDSVDENRVGGNSFGTHNRLSRKQRLQAFRSQCKITKYCGTCGLSGSGCGQC